MWNCARLKDQLNELCAKISSQNLSSIDISIVKMSCGGGGEKKETPAYSVCEGGVEGETSLFSYKKEPRLNEN